MPAKKSDAAAPKDSFSIDDFLGEIEAAEDERLNKRLPQERLKNKRQLDNAARRAAEANGTGIQPLVPQPLEKPVKEKKTTRSAATGMQLKAPKSKANSVDRAIALGARLHEAPRDFGHGFIGATVLDPFGNILGMMFNPHYVEMRDLGPLAAASD